MARQQLVLHPPRDWQVFEEICHSLWEREWKCATIQQHGRSGQAQHGVDIYGKPDGGAHYHGIQCKAKSSAAGRIAALSVKDIRREVEEARTFAPPLKGLIIATTAASDVKIQTIVRKLSEEHVRQGLFTIDVLAWPEIVARLVQHEDLLERFYPGASARWKGMAQQVDELHRRAMGLNEQFGHGGKRVVMMAPEPPDDFVKRPAEFDVLKKHLLDTNGDAIAITAALLGAGGYGKTTLATALAHDPDIQDAYFDGILWVVLGEAPRDLLAKIFDLIEILTGERPGLVDVDSAAAKLSEALGDRRILMIIDDVWREQDLRPFLQGGPRTTRLITTRLTRVLPASIAIRQPVDAMTVQQARELLSRGMPDDQALSQSRVLSDLARRLGKWAQLLKLVNGFLRERVIYSRQPLRDALVDADERLTEEGFTAFDAHDQDDRTKAVARTINLSLSLLDAGQRTRFAELAVFPEDADIPAGIVARLWQETASLSEGRTKDLLVRLYGLSLLLDLDLNQRTLRFHDTTRRFLQDRAGRDGLVVHHKQLLNALDKIRWSPLEADALSRHYFYLHFPHHLAEAEERERLNKVLLDPGWLKAKLEATGNPSALVADFEQYAVGQLESLIGQTLRLTLGICARDVHQLIPQLLGRLMACEDIAARHFLDAARRHLERPAILTQLPSLTPPGVETARLEGHTNWVTALCVLPDGRLASGSYDHTIRLWDLETGVETACLDGQPGSVSALCVLPDGRLASGFHDNTIRLWDVKTGAETARLEGHSAAVIALCVLPDGRLASGSPDRTIRLWNPKIGAETSRLEGHTDSVAALCVLPDGRLASGSYDHTIRLWDLETGGEIARLDRWPDLVTALCVLPDGRLASGFNDSTIRLWDVKTGVETARLDGHSGSVTALCVLPDGRLASSCNNRGIRLWDLTTGAVTARLDGHSNSVTALCVLLDGRLASGSLEPTIRLWAVKTGAGTARLDWHSDSVTALCLLPDGRLASGSLDRTIRLWDLTTGSMIGRLDMPTGSVTALCVLPDGRLASGYDPKTIRLWDLKIGFVTARLDNHRDPVNALCVLPDGRLASGSLDRTIRLWAVDLKTCTRRDGHSDSVTTLCVLPDGRLASGSLDRTIRLWDVKTGTFARLDGHSGSVTVLCVLPDGRLASGSTDRMIRLWDVKTGAETARLNGHSGPVTALCVLPDGRLASGSLDRTIRLWDVKIGAETACLEFDATVRSVAALPDGRVVAGDELGFVHWLKIVD